MLKRDALGLAYSPEPEGDQGDDDALFTEPSFDDELDVRAEIARTPVSAVVKGFIITDVAKIATAHGHDVCADRRWVAFKDYTIREMMEVEAAVARALHPKQTLREGLRRIGHHIYPAFAASLVGRAIFSFAGDQLGLALRLADRAYRVAGAPARVELVSFTEGRAVLRHVDQYNFLDSHQVGIFEGAIHAFQAEGAVRVRKLSATSAEFEVTWRNRKA